MYHTGSNRAHHRSVYYCWKFGRGVSDIDHLADHCQRPTLQVMTNFFLTFGDDDRFADCSLTQSKKKIDKASSVQ